MSKACTDVTEMMRKKRERNIIRKQTKSIIILTKVWRKILRWNAVLYNTHFIEWKTINILLVWVYIDTLYISISIVIVNNIFILCNEHNLFYNALLLRFCFRNHSCLLRIFPLYFCVTIVRITYYTLCFAYMLFARIKSILLISHALQKNLCMAVCRWK